ncbi:MAG: YceI family protein [Sphingobacteriales bacterium]|nr:YceI family protein [Sphingobacteriales bacterium]
MSSIETKSIWLIDPVHSKIRFETKYLLISSVSGWFSEIEGSVVTTSDDFTDSEVNITIYVNSLTTGNEERDNHLRSADFFDAKTFPIITFRCQHVKVDESFADVKGFLCLKGITAEIKFNADYLGSVKDPMGNSKAGFKMATSINRKDFNISWNQYFDTSGVLLSDEVQIVGDIQLLKVS